MMIPPHPWMMIAMSAMAVSPSLFSSFLDDAIKGYTGTLRLFWPWLIPYHKHPYSIQGLSVVPSRRMSRTPTSTPSAPLSRPTGILTRPSCGHDRARPHCAVASKFVSRASLRRAENQRVLHAELQTCKGSKHTNNLRQCASPRF
jgi:hypothetical protein